MYSRLYVLNTQRNKTYVLYLAAYIYFFCAYRISLKGKTPDRRQLEISNSHRFQDLQRSP